MRKKDILRQAQELYVRKCNFCNKEIDKNKKSGTRFCGKECSYLNIKKKKRGDDKNIDKNCKTCNKKLIDRKKGQEYCNLSCSSKRVSDEFHLSPRDSITGKCIICGEKTGRKRNIYCSQICHGKQSGENNKLKLKTDTEIIETYFSTRKTKDERIDEMGSTMSIRDFKEKYVQDNSKNQFAHMIRQSARGIYRNLKKIGCQKCGFNTKCQVSHIIEIKKFAETDQIRRINHPNNILILCKNHHTRFDSGHLLLKDIPVREGQILEDREIIIKKLNESFFKTKEKIVVRKLVESKIDSKTLGEIVKEFESKNRHQSFKYIDIRNRSRAVNGELLLSACAFCESTEERLELCHIKGIAKFDLNAKVSEINSRENIVAACGNCHGLLDAGMIKIEDRKDIKSNDQEDGISI